MGTIRTTILALAACAACLPVCAQVEINNTGEWANIRCAAQEVNGPICFAGESGVWCPWHWNENWQPGSKVTPSNASSGGDIADGIVFNMDTAPDGAVLSLCTRKSDGSAFLVSVRGNNAGCARLCGIPGKVSLAKVMVDSHANLWVTVNGVNICKAVAPNRRTLAFVEAVTLPELWPGGDSLNRLPLSMAEDARERIWFWSNFLHGDNSCGSVHGVLIQENGTVSYHAVLGGVADGPISVIAPLDSDTLWLAVRDAGIYSVDLDTLAGTPVAEPETNAFRVVQNIFTVGADRYVISGREGEFYASGLQSSLWRWRAQHWTKVIDGLDSYGSREQLADRRWCATRDGLWLGALGTGGWFVPADGSPAQAINWRKNSPFDTINRWFQVQDGRMVAVQFERGGLVADPALLTEKSPLPPRAGIVRAARPLFRTVEKKVFGVLLGAETALSEWDGKEWQPHPIPDNLPLWGECVITSDSKGRVWLANARYSPYEELVPTYIYDPRRGEFSKFPNLRSALEAQFPDPPDFHAGNAPLFAPEFSRDGRICYEQGHWLVNYFDGRAWHVYNQISGITFGETLSVNPRETRPFFDKDGTLSIVLHGGVWQLDGQAAWKKSALKPEAVEPALVSDDISSTPPYEPDAESIVTGENGIFWVVAGRQLFRAGYGLHAACFAQNEPQPFVDKRKLTGVFADIFGNNFLRTSIEGRDEYVLLPAPGPLPHSTAKLLENGEEGVTLQLAADIPSPRFIWRVDDSAWTQGATNAIVSLKDLSAGHHRVQFLSIDDHLQTDPAPVEVSFDTRSISDQRIQDLIAQLGDKDFARRESAVTVLTRHSKIALPALRAARQNESDPDRRWWLDAAMQECIQ